MGNKDVFLCYFDFHNVFCNGVSANEKNLDEVKGFLSTFNSKYEKVVIDELSSSRQRLIDFVSDCRDVGDNFLSYVFSNNVRFPIQQTTINSLQNNLLEKTVNTIQKVMVYVMFQNNYTFYNSRIIHFHELEKRGDFKDKKKAFDDSNFSSQVFNREKFENESLENVSGDNKTKKDFFFSCYKKIFFVYVVDLSKKDKTKEDKIRNAEKFCYDLNSFFSRFGFFINEYNGFFDDFSKNNDSISDNQDTSKDSSSEYVGTKIRLFGEEVDLKDICSFGEKKLFKILVSEDKGSFEDFKRKLSELQDALVEEILDLPENWFDGLEIPHITFEKEFESFLYFKNLGLIEDNSLFLGNLWKLILAEYAYFEKPEDKCYNRTLESIQCLFGCFLDDYKSDTSTLSGDVIFIGNGDASNGQNNSSITNNDKFFSLSDSSKSESDDEIFIGNGDASNGQNNSSIRSGNNLSLLGDLKDKKDPFIVKCNNCFDEIINFYKKDILTEKDKKKVNTICQTIQNLVENDVEKSNETPGDLLGFKTDQDFFDALGSLLQELKNPEIESLNKEKDVQVFWEKIWNSWYFYGRRLKSNDAKNKFRKQVILWIRNFFDCVVLQKKSEKTNRILNNANKLNCSVNSMLKSPSSTSDLDSIEICFYSDLLCDFDKLCEPKDQVSSFFLEGMINQLIENNKKREMNFSIADIKGFMKDSFLLGQYIIYFITNRNVQYPIAKATAEKLVHKINELKKNLISFITGVSSVQNQYIISCLINSDFNKSIDQFYQSEEENQASLREAIKGIIESKETGLAANREKFFNFYKRIFVKMIYNLKNKTLDENVIAEISSSLDYFFICMYPDVKDIFQIDNNTDSGNKFSGTNYKIKKGNTNSSGDSNLDQKVSKDNKTNPENDKNIKIKNFPNLLKGTNTPKKIPESVPKLNNTTNNNTKNPHKENTSSNNGNLSKNKPNTKNNTIFAHLVQYKKRYIQFGIAFAILSLIVMKNHKQVRAYLRI